MTRSEELRRVRPDKSGNYQRLGFDPVFSLPLFVEVSTINIIY